ncbi:MAG: MBL fold metallo-hydrolase [Alphaproteobacteria bacterium]|jgi:glyoxylase-like metal-dependent hydrolase (beta-lactamase superfamily II)|nr:MBL fold metallo-hydrolase [Alphaproteobacteria bacterium]MDP6567578.1 MBL fold metallo-hydrolase [Alphaproteobacteria bacterium]MDP6816221.1 MBL fold metallo-hydrolase [Alphaproteobacteria bacterium]
MADEDELDYPVAEAIAPGAVHEVAPGVFWLRMPLDLTGLDHINLWLLRDGDGWTVVDTGMKSDRIHEIWEGVFAEQLDGRPITRVICTHFHPDHMGQAGWLTRHWNCALWTTRQEWLFGRMISLDRQDEVPTWFLDHYRRIGLSDRALTAMSERGYNHYNSVVTPIPDQVRRVSSGEVLRIGAHDWQVITGQGHSPEHVCLFCEELGLMISGDQVLPRITPHIGIYPSEPDANPLQDYIDSLDKFAGLPSDLLVLPAHGLPFRGLEKRLDALRRHHADRLNLLEDFCVEPTRALSTLEAMFGRRLSPFEAFLGLAESMAHLNCLMGQGRVARDADDQGVWRYQATSHRADAA